MKNESSLKKKQYKTWHSNWTNTKDLINNNKAERERERALSSGHKIRTAERQSGRRE